MSNFIKLGPCPYCGSRDNRAEYVNGYWCFGCSKLEVREDTQSLRDRLARKTIADSNLPAYLIDTITEIPQMAMKWLLKYNITMDEIKRYGIKWCPSKQLLVLLIRTDYWQGRNFGYGNQKYKSSGNKPLTIYGKGDILVVVEDVLSAIKIARLAYEGYSGFPLLGSSLSKQAESLLSKKYKKVYVWLDRDKAKQAVRIRNRLREIGIDSRAIVSPLDPKEYSKEELKEYLK